MKLEYTDIFGGGKRKKIAATITIEHLAKKFILPYIDRFNKEQ